MTEIDDYSARVLDVVDAIPAGQVMSYGDVAEYLGEGGPRQVGRVMARYGGGAPWWRVIHADGTPAPGHDSRALAHYLAEGTPLLSPGGTRQPAEPAPTRREPVRVRVDMRQARWSGRALAAGGQGRWSRERRPGDPWRGEEASEPGGPRPRVA